MPARCVRAATAGEGARFCCRPSCLPRGGHAPGGSRDRCCAPLMAKGVRHLKTCAAPGRPGAEVGRDLTGYWRPHMPLALNSPAFSPDGTIPTKYTCDGDETSPPLEWSGVPDKAMSLALIVDDPDAPDPAAPKRRFVHWLLYNIPPDARGLPE